MDHQPGFLDDTSLSKTPRSPLKTSTVLKPNPLRGENVPSKPSVLHGFDSTFDPLEGPSHPALNEVTNIPNFAALKLKFNATFESSFAGDRNSSLGILQMDNCSDFTDTSLTNLTCTKSRVKSKKFKQSKLCNLKEDKSQSSLKENCTLNSLSGTNVLSVQEKDGSENEESSSSSDIEYDGTNIPELNLDYNPFSSLTVTDAPISKSKLSEIAISNERPQSVYTTTTISKNDSNHSDLTNTVARKFTSEPGSFTKHNSSKPRDSIFQSFDPSYETIFKRLLPDKGASDDESAKLSEVTKACPISDTKSTERESLAELHFAKSLEKLSCSQTSSLKFCADEISARSSSFRSSEESSNVSKTCISSNSDTFTQTKYLLNAEGFKDEVLGGSLFTLSQRRENSESCDFSRSVAGGNPIADTSECVDKGSSFFTTEKNTSSPSVTDGLAFHCDLNLKDMSVFMNKNENEHNPLEVSDSEFISPDEAFEMFKKDEEIHKQERRFEIGNMSKGSIFSNLSPPSQNDISAPSWFLELNGSQSQESGHHISIGTLISARTEHLGRLSQDSKRERPFFGTVVTTPVRNMVECFSESMGSDFESASIESSPTASQRERLDALSETSELSYENAVPSNTESALSNVLTPDHLNRNETGILRRSVLSQLLNELSTTQPMTLASKILEKCRPINKHFSIDQSHDLTCTSTVNPLQSGSSKQTESSPITSDDDSDKMDGTLTRSSSGDSIGRELQEAVASTTKKHLVLPHVLSISNVEANNKNMNKNLKSNGCPNCHYPHNAVPYTCTRPPSSCSTSCSNATPMPSALQAQYGCVKYFNSSQEHCNQKIFPSCGSLPHSENGSHGCHSYNPYAQDVLHSQFLTVPAPRSFQQPLLQPGYAPFPLTVQGSTVYSYPVVQGPNELVFPEKLSVGDSQNMSITVQNFHNLHFFHVSYVSAFLNEKPVSLEMAGLSFSSIVPRSTGNTTDIQITLSPKYEGKITATIQIVGNFNPAEITLAAISNLSLKTKIQYESLRPSIFISSEKKRNLDLGPLIAGSTVVKYITISNNCDAAVPMCISLSHDLQDNRISFGIDHMKRQKYLLKILSPKAIFYRLPRSIAESVSQIDIPVIIEAGSEDSSVHFTLTAAIETSTIRETLGFLRISASVGIAKLVLTNATQNRLLLRARVGTVSSQTLNIKNHSSFPIVYDFIVVDDDTQSFSVSPASLNLQSMQNSVVSITFSPSSTQIVKGFLQAAAQPHGKVFPLAELIGDGKQITQDQGPSRNSAVIKPPERASREPRFASHSSNVIECNKKYLSWGGVDVGDSVIKTFSIRNSLNKSFQAKLFIKEKSQSFKLLDDKNEHSINLTVTLTAKEQQKISVVFSPRRISLSSGFLGIKPLLENQPKIFSMPLCGYGGTGKLKVTQVSEREGVGRCLDINLPREKRPVFSSVILHNTGSRALFVKVLVKILILAESSPEPSNGEQVSIHPSEFVFLENENKTLYVSYTPPTDFHARCAGVRGVITLLYGDEVLRQQMRRFKNEIHRSSQVDLSGGVQFDVQFAGEERVPYDSLYQCIPKVSSLFSTAMREYGIHLNIMEQNESCSQMTFDALSTLENTYPDFTINSTMYSRRLTSTGNYGHSPPVKDFTVDMLNRLSMPHQTSYMDELPQNSLFRSDDHSIAKESATECWAVKPEILTIDSSNKDNRILLINLSKSDLKFKVECAINVISVSPVSGVIAAKGNIGLRITIIPYSHNKLCEDYKGYIKVICGGSEKRVLVNVLKDQRKTNNNLASDSNVEEQLQAVLEKSSSDRTITSSSASVIIKDICEFPKEVVLNTTAPGKVSESVVTVQNIKKCSARWEIQPVSILFSESLEDSLTATQILQILPSSGILKTMEISTIVIKFMPSRPDRLSQFFKLSIIFEDGSEQNCNFKVGGRATFCLTESVDINNSGNSECSTKKSKETIFVVNEACEFPTTAPGQTSTVYATVKNLSPQDIKLNVIKPHLPFVINQSSVLIRSRKFLKIPISFKPKVSRIYDDILVLHSEIGHQFMITLKGTCN